MSDPASPPGRNILDQLIDTTQDAVIFIDREAHIVRFNRTAETMFGYTSDEVLGKNVAVLMPQPYRGEHDGYLSNYRTTGQKKAIGKIREVTALRANGESFPIELSVTEMKGLEGIAYAAFIRDTSVKQRLQRELVERERLAAIGTTAATFAHEIGNPLNSMYMNAQLLERRLKREAPDLSDRITSRVSAISEEISRLNELLQEFRALSRRQRFEVTRFDLPEYIRVLLDQDAPAHEAAGVDVRFEADPHQLEIEADRTKIAQVFLNLTKNAVEAMPKGGELTIRLAKDGDGVRVDVQDTGIGVDEGIDVFAPFASTKSEGTGLGLSVVQRLVDNHGGQIYYRSQIGEGTTFSIELPLTQRR